MGVYLCDSSGESQLAFSFTDTDSPNESIYKDVSAKMPEDAEEGDVVYIVMHGQAQDIYYQTGLRYENKFFGLLNDMFGGALKSFSVDKHLNIIQNDLSNSGFKEKLKNMWQMIAAYNLTVLIRHMMLDGEPFWDAFKATLKEFTVNTLKQSFANVLANAFNLRDTDIEIKALIDTFGDFFFNTIVDSTVSQFGSEANGDDTRMVLKFGDAEIHITGKRKNKDGSDSNGYEFTSSELGELSDEVKGMARNLLRNLLNTAYSAIDFLAQAAQAIPEVIPYTPDDEAEQLAQQLRNNSVTRS